MYNVKIRAGQFSIAKHTPRSLHIFFAMNFFTSPCLGIVEIALFSGLKKCCGWRLLVKGNSLEFQDAGLIFLPLENKIMTILQCFYTFAHQNKAIGIRY
jgi:hypothetical protein